MDKSTALVCCLVLTMCVIVLSIMIIADVGIGEMMRENGKEVMNEITSSNSSALKLLN